MYEMKNMRMFFKTQANLEVMNILFYTFYFKETFKVLK